jgi:threonine dehydratase
LIDSDQLLIEASGIAGVAAVLAGKVSNAKKCMCVLTGGNVDVVTLKTVLNSAPH